MTKLIVEPTRARLRILPALLLLLALRANAATCDLAQYKPAPDLTATSRADAIELSWTGERNEQLRAVFAVQNGQPVIQEFAARKPGGSWIILGRNLSPEYQVITGKRRLSEQQMAPMRELGIQFTPEVVERGKVECLLGRPAAPSPVAAGQQSDLPRKPEEIRRRSATFQTTGCAVKTDGARIEVTFPGVQLGIFSGDLRYTVYRGSNLLRQEVVASTSEPSVAFKYNAGLKGFTITGDSKMVWRDTARAWQQYEFGGAVNQEGVA